MSTDDVSKELFGSVQKSRGVNVKCLKAVEGLGIGDDVRLWQDEKLKDIPCGSTQDIIDVVLSDGVRTVGSAQNNNGNAGRIDDVKACQGDVDKLYRLYYKLPVGKDISTTWEGYSMERKDAETKVLEAALQVSFRELVSKLVFSSYDESDGKYYKQLNSNEIIRDLKASNANNGNNNFDEKCNDIAKKALEEWRKDHKDFDLTDLLNPNGLGEEKAKALEAILLGVMSLEG